MGLASAASSAEAALVPPSADVFFAHYLTLAVFTLAYAFLGALWVCVVPRLRSKALRGLVHSFAVGACELAPLVSGAPRALVSTFSAFPPRVDLPSTSCRG